MNLEKKLIEISNEYPDIMISSMLLDVNRVSHDINLVINSCKFKSPFDLEICDLGGGFSHFLIGCASINFKRTVLVDDFDDPNNHVLGTAPLKIHKKYGVEVFSQDVIEKGFNNIDGYFDVITSFDSMEHWHNSPKKLFHEVANKLKKNGIFIIGVPNCVNLRKRITVPFGFGKWSPMSSWYEQEKFRGHVREPDVSDLIYMANDIKLTNIKIYGRNWLGLTSNNKFIRVLSRMIDPILKFFPSLCSDLYMVGTKE